MRIFTKIVLYSASVLIWANLAASAAQFRAGAAAVDITPWMGVSINGYFNDRVGTNVHDPLHARCLVLDDGSNRLAFVVADNCLIYRETFDRAKAIVHKRSGFPVQNILMSATHCHNGGSVIDIFQSNADPEYEHFLSVRMADAVLQAINNLAPAQIGWGSADEPRHVFNRRWKMKPGVINQDPFGGTNDQVRMNPLPGSPELLQPAGPTDPQVSVLAVKSLDGRPIALLANYSLHYVGDVTAGTFSADYCGAFCDRIQQLLKADRQDPPFVAIMSNGTSADVNTVHFTEPLKKPAEPPYTVIRRVANDVADAALKAYLQIQFRPWVPLRSAQREITLGVRHPTPSQLQRARDLLAKGKFPTADRELVYARELVLLNQMPAQTNLLLQTFAVGDLGVAAIPCEVFAEIGLDLKKNSPFKSTFTIELANGYYGYLPSPRQHAMGGYETWPARSSYLETEASPKILSNIIELFNQLQ